MNLFVYCDCGFIFEGLLNYFVLFGWFIVDDYDLFGFDEMVVVFDVVDVNFSLVWFD